MKKKPSKSTFVKNNNKTIANLPESKKTSRIVKANSCVKINSISSEQNSKLQPFSHTAQTHQVTSNIIKQNVSSRNLSKYSVNQHQMPSEKQPSSNQPSNRYTEKPSFQTISHRYQEQLTFHKIVLKNQELSKQNASLKLKCNDIQEMSLRDKQKIKNLIIRINQMKAGNTFRTQHKDNKMSTTNLPLHNIYENSQSKSYLPLKGRVQTPYKGLTQGICDNKECIQRQKYLQAELYKERLMHDRLQVEKREWQRNRQELKNEYNELLSEIREMRDKQF